MFVEYYTGLFGTAKSRTGIEAICMNEGLYISNIEAEYLIANLTKEEIKGVVFGIDNEKALGPYGYIATFFKVNWDKIGGLVEEAILEFFRHGKLLRQWSHTVIALIPKTNHEPTMQRISLELLIGLKWLS